MCEVLIIGKFSNSFKNHCGDKTKNDDIKELRKITKTFNGTYIVRRGVVMSSDFDAMSIVKFSCELDCDKFMQALEQSDYFSSIKLFKLSSIEKLESKFVAINNVLNIS